MPNLIYFLDVSQISHNDISRFASYLSLEKKKKLETQNFACNRCSLVADLLIRYVLCCFEGLTIEETQIVKTKKPEIISGRLKFNVSHSRDFIVCVVGEAELGIDLEVSRKISNMLTLARRFFTPAEFCLLANALPSEQEQLFFKLWTLKESLFKQIGCGVKARLNTISFAGQVREAEFETQYEGKPYFFKQLLHKEFMIAVCSEKRRTDEIKEIEAREILFFFECLEGGKKK